MFLPVAERLVVRRARSVAARPVGADAVAVATGGLSRHAALRMSAMDEQVRAAVSDGLDQVVIVGAGFDTRAWRLPLLEDCTVWELDLPGTQRAKRAGLGDRAAARHVRFVEADLSTVSLLEALEPAGHATDRQTVWIWEAVAPYLPPAAVVRTLEGIAACSAPGSRLAMTFANPSVMGPRSLAPVTGTLAGYGFQALGEPILSTYDEWEICEALQQAGFTDTVVTDTDVWARDAGFSARPDPLRAEMLATARV